MISLVRIWKSVSTYQNPELNIDGHHAVVCAVDLLANVVPASVVVRVVPPEVLQVQDDPESVAEEEEQNHAKHRVGLPELIPFSVSCSMSKRTGCTFSQLLQ